MIKLDSLAPILFLVMWSSGAVIVKLGLQFSSEWSFLAIRAVISLASISMICLIAKYLFNTQFLKPSKEELKIVLSVGLLLQVLYLAFYILAIATGMSPGLVTLVLGIQPLITPLLCKQKVSRTKLVLLSFGFTGLSIAIAGAQSLDNVEWIGILFSVLALLSLTMGTVKQACVTMNSFQAMWYQCVLSSIVFFALSVSTEGYIDWQPEFVFSVLWMSLVVSVGALLLLMYMVKRDSSDKVSILFYAIPMLTYLFDHLLFGTTLTPLTMLGMAIVAICIVLYRRQPRLTRGRDKLSVASQNNH
ncbi:DMT family transporter [Vibrio sp. VPAP30]|uniref:DMT family transporter n=1 Tax=Vibrio sp. VPAP30 TaxID=1647102 RepID=UPI0006598CCB|nr:DMT family transporter [Vibrio sp. VPAP30]KLN62743.1 membrane protein [Vibrio sp. VPAP30]